MDFKKALEQGLIDKHKSEPQGPKVQQNRKEKRRNGRAAKGDSKRRVQVKGSTSALLAQGSRARTSGKTGQPAWWAAEKARTERERQLKAISTRRLRRSIGDAAEALYRAGFKTLWDLAQAAPDEIKVVPAFGPGARLSIKKYLGDAGVQVKW